SGIALAFSWMSPTAAMVVFFISWWVHTITLLSFLVYVPQSKHAHLIAAPVNVLLSKRVPGQLEKLNFDMDEDDMESEEDISSGVGKVEDFSQYQMLVLFVGENVVQ